MDMQKKIEKLAQEIKRKGEYLNYESLDLATGGHLSAYHVGLSDESLNKRMKAEHKVVSTFNSAKDVNGVLCHFFHGEFSDSNCLALAKWICNNTADKRLNTGDIIDGASFGRVCMKNGFIAECDEYEFTLQKNDEYYRNKITGMPFDFITIKCNSSIY